MPTSRKPEAPATPRRPPAQTPQARERQLTALAFDLAEEQLRNRTASSQVITHFLKYGSEREALERERLANEVALMEAKREAIASANRQEELFGEAIKAMSRYTGQSPGDSE